MSKKPFNPGRFDGALNEKLYATGWEGVALLSECKKFVRLLRTKHKDKEGAQALADKMEACEKKRRCKSPACAQCAHAAQTLLAKMVADFLAKHQGPGQLVCVSIVPADGACGVSKLSVDYAKRNVRRWKEWLGRAGVTWFIGALDYSLNEHDADRYKPHWSEHLYGLTMTTDIDLLKKELRKQFPGTDAIPRPVKVKSWDGGERALSYIMKPNNWRRVATDDGERFARNKDEKRSCRATDKQRLKSKQRVRLGLYLDDLGFHGRLVFRWAQFVNRGPTACIEDRVPATAVTKRIKSSWNKREAA